MNDKLSYEAINWIIETINKWLDNAPDYIVELVDRYQNYYIVSNWFWAFCGFIWFIFWIILMISWIKNEEDWQIWIWFFLALFWFILWACFVCSLIQWIYVPEIALIHSFSSCWH